MTDVFPLIAVQRRAVADLLDSLSAEEWLTPTLCEGWRVQELAAHGAAARCAALHDGCVGGLRCSRARTA